MGISCLIFNGYFWCYVTQLTEIIALKKDIYIFINNSVKLKWYLKMNNFMGIKPSGK